jgi:hypothetical protein
VTLTLQVIEEAEYQSRSDVGQHHHGGHLVQALLREVEEQNERIAVGCHGPCTHCALLGQVLGEEQLD